MLDTYSLRAMHFYNGERYTEANPDVRLYSNNVSLFGYRNEGKRSKNG